MRIKSVRAWWVRIPIETSRQHRSDFGQVRTFDAAILRIETDDGLVGWGEASLNWKTRAVTGAVEDLEPLLIGKDPRDIEHILRTLESVRHMPAEFFTTQAKR